jgi:DNA-binding response OmpR family regulator
MTKPKILVAEDEQDLTELYQEVLESAGFEVLISNTGAGAASLITTTKFNAIVTDIAMPGMTGLQIAELARQSEFNRDALIVLVSGRVDMSATAKALKLGIRDVFVKPVLPSQIAERVKARLAKT